MSNNIWDHPEITPERIEKSMRQARVERSKAVWAILQSLFSRVADLSQLVAGQG